MHSLPFLRALTAAHPRFSTFQFGLYQPKFYANPQSLGIDIRFFSMPSSEKKIPCRPLLGRITENTYLLHINPFSLPVMTRKIEAFPLRMFSSFSTHNPSSNRSIP